VSRQTRLRRRRSLVALIVGALLLATAVLMGTAMARAGDKPAQVGEAVTTAWPTNAAGQTYGNLPDAKSPYDAPDLIGTVATNGGEGYVLKTDMMRPRPKTAEEAAAYNQAVMKGWTIPVFESDGVTQIGVFQCGGPGTQSTMTSADGTTITSISNADGSVTTTTTSGDRTAIKTENQP
jgi:hypothetical protein